MVECRACEIATVIYVVHKIDEATIAHLNCVLIYELDYTNIRRIYILYMIVRRAVRNYSFIIIKFFVVFN